MLCRKRPLPPSNTLAAAWLFVLLLLKCSVSMKQKWTVLFHSFLPAVLICFCVVFFVFHLHYRHGQVYHSGYEWIDLLITACMWGIFFSFLIPFCWLSVIKI
jgi:hypothetical protein